MDSPHDLSGKKAFVTGGKRRILEEVKELDEAALRPLQARGGRMRGVAEI